MSDSDDDFREKQIKIVVIGDGASGKVFKLYYNIVNIIIFI